MNKKQSMPKIAIVGLGAHFPGAKNLKEFWQNIINKKDCIQEVPSDFWDYKEHYDANPFARDKTYCKYGGFLPAVLFDALEFGIPPKTLEAISLNQLMALLVAKEALVDARILGDDPVDFDRSKVGVVLGANLGGNAFPLRERVMLPSRMQKMLDRHGVDQGTIDKVKADIQDGYVEWSEDSFPGFLANIVSSRIVNRFDFGGPNFTVDAACASSHCAMGQAMQELHSGNCDVMLTGGVNVSNDPFSYLSFSKTPALSLQNKIRPYDKAADGTLVGDGLGMLVLMRLEDAEAKGLKIYAVIRGLGSASDGKAKSIYAPRQSGQVQALERAYEHAGLTPDQVGLVEGHGTGTPVGDACEIEALKEAFNDHAIEKQSIALGSVKSQIGHTTQASGAASAIKAVLALHHKILPPTINVTEVNPDFELEQSPFFVCKDAQPWFHNKEGGRVAAVSSFGFGGINYHMLLEEYIPSAKLKVPAYNKRVHFLPYQIVLAHSSLSGLQDKCRDMITRLEDVGEFTDIRALVEEFVTSKPDQADHRLGFVAADTETLSAKLNSALKRLETSADDVSWSLPDQIHYRSKAMDAKSKVVVMFSSQGSQYVNMGKELAIHYPEMREAFADIDTLLQEKYKKPALSKLYFQRDETELLSDADVEQINSTEHVQPALAALCAGYYRILKNQGLKADMLLGHSFGELTSLWAAEAISQQDFFDVSIARGLAMQVSSDASGDLGSMLAISKPPENIEELIADIEGIQVANYNSADQVVLSGSSKGIKTALSKFAEMKIKAIELPVSGAFHSPYMQPAAKEFAKALKKVKFSVPKMPVYANVSAKPYASQVDQYAPTLTDHLLQPVLFKQSLEAAYAAGGRIFLELGPKSILSTFARSTIDADDAQIISVNPNVKKSSVQQLLEAVTQLRILGVDLVDDLYEPQVLKSSKEQSKLTVRLHGRHHFTQESLDKMTKAGTEIHSNRDMTPKVGSPSTQAATLAEQVAQTQAPEQTAPQAQAPQQAAAQAPQQPAASVQNNAAPQAASTAQAQPATQQPAPAPTSSVQNGAAVPLNDVLQCQTANNHVQNQFYQTQAQQMAVLDKLLDRQQNAMQQVPGDQAQQVSSEHMQAFEALCQHSQNMFAAHDAFLNNQNVILSRLLGQGAISSQASLAQAGSVAAQPMTQTASVNLSAMTQTAAAAPAQQQATMSAAPAAAAPVMQQAQAAAAAEGVDAELLLSELMSIVSDTTGYPQDVIDMDMDLEADLGIDSIKRVEIFSTLNEKFPQYGERIDIADLAALATIQEIVDYFSGLIIAEAGAAPVAPAVEPSAQQATPLAALSAAPAVAAASPAAAQGASSSVPMSADKFSKLLVDIIVDVTGYPADVIDFSMDLEADLGIDSIKRVEMFSVLQDEYGDILNNLDPAELMQLTTLQQIADFFVSFANGGANDAGAIELDEEAANTLKKSQAGAQANPQDLNTESVVNGVNEINESLLKKNTTTNTAARYKAAVKLVELPSSIRLADPSERHVLVTDDGFGTGFLLSEKLREQGYKVTVVQFSELTKNLDAVRYATNKSECFDASLASLNDQGVKQLLDTISQQRGAISGFIHVNAAVNSQRTLVEMLEGVERQMLKSVFFFAKHLKMGLVDSASAGRSFFMVVSRIDGMFGHGDEKLNSVVQGGYSGLVKTLKMEAPKLFCRTLDLSMSIKRETISQIVLQELLDSSNKFLEVGRTDLSKRYAIEKNAAPIPELANTQQPDKDTVFLVSGGGRGVTADCAVGLAQLYHCKFILIGRTALNNDEPQWAQDAHDEKSLRGALLKFQQAQGIKPVPAILDKEIKALLVQREIKQTLAAIEAANGQALYISADLSDAQKAQESIKQAASQLGEISGFIHGAGNLADKHIEDKLEEDYDLVYQSKVDSLKHIFQCLDPQQLKFMILFSSISGFYGQMGQSDYALSNEILNKFAFAAQQKYPHMLVRSINWGPWDGGMVAPALKRIYEKFNLTVMPIAEGVEFFVNELLFSDDINQVLVCPKNIDEVRSGLMEESLPKLSS